MRGFVPDYIRLWIIYNYGGIYLDTDVEIIKDFTPLLNNKAFASMQEPGSVALGLGFGAEAGNAFIADHMKQYEQLKFINDDGSFYRTPSPQYTTQLLINRGFELGNERIQNLKDLKIFPPEFFCLKS